MSDTNKNKQLINLITPTQGSRSSQVYPFIDNLVDSLYNSNLNNLIDKNTQENTDKSVFMMFVNIYFMAYLHSQTQDNSNTQSQQEQKQNLKQMLSEVIRCPEKRQVCVSLIKQINPLFNMDTLIENTIEDNDHLLEN